MMFERFPKQTKMSNHLSDGIEEKLHVNTQFLQLFKGKLFYSHQYLLSLNLSTAHVDVRDVAVCKRKKLATS